MILYIAGPMRGLPAFNFGEFDKARDSLKWMGHEAISPADHDRDVFPHHDWDAIDATIPEGFTIEAALEWDFGAILRADGIALLPGWENSEGSKAEKFVAEQTGKKVFLLRLLSDRERLLPFFERHPLPPYDLVEYRKPALELVTHRGAALREAERLITGDRNKSYGSPTQNFQDTAGMWTIQLRHLLQEGAAVSPQDVAAMMVALKLVRRIASDKADNWLDILGYGACGYEAAVETQAFPAFEDVA